jgi:hydroxyacylglutathione hydrolase
MNTIKTLILMTLFLTTRAEAQLSKIIPIKLSQSNAYLVRGDKFVLIDCGRESDGPLLEKELLNYGVKLEDVSALILTHGHYDHAGGAARFAANHKTKIIAGKEDLFMMGEGKNDNLNPTNFTAMFIKLFVDTSYPPFIPTLLVDSPVDLDSFGFLGKAIPMPGHTPGSLIVTVPDGTMFVGDMILGGYFGGMLFPSQPQEHYFHADRERNRSNIGKVLQMGGTTFYLGHGGPVSKEDVIKSFKILM